MTAHAVQIILKSYLPAIGGISRRNGGKTAVFLTFSLIMLEFWFLDSSMIRRKIMVLPTFWQDKPPMAGK
jgi:hypothetical protein